MAEDKSNREAVEKAERDMYGPMAEAHSLISLYVHTEDMESWSVVAHGCLERFARAFEEYQHLVSKHGRQATNVLLGLGSEGGAA